MTIFKKIRKKSFFRNIRLIKLFIFFEKKKKLKKKKKKWKKMEKKRKMEKKYGFRAERKSISNS